MSANTRKQTASDKDDTSRNQQSQQEQQTEQNVVPQIPSADAAHRMKNAPLNGLSPAAAVSLQRSVGNKTVTKMLASRKGVRDKSSKTDGQSSPEATTSLQRHPDDSTSQARSARLGAVGDRSWGNLDRSIGNKVRSHNNATKISTLEQAASSNRGNLEAFVEHHNTSLENQGRINQDHSNRISNLESGSSSGSGGGDSDVTVESPQGGL